MAEVIDISDSDEEAAAAEEEEEAAEAAPEATESLTPQAGRPLVDELDLVDSQRGLLEMRHLRAARCTTCCG